LFWPFNVYEERNARQWPNTKLEERLPAQVFKRRVQNAGYEHKAERGLAHAGRRCSKGVRQ
jgi:hypothetical protein